MVHCSSKHLLCVNTLYCRSTCAPGLSFADFCVRGVCVEAEQIMYTQPPHTLSSCHNHHSRNTHTTQSRCDQIIGPMTDRMLDYEESRQIDKGYKSLVSWSIRSYPQHHVGSRRRPQCEAQFPFSCSTAHIFLVPCRQPFWQPR